ncbi:MAG: hypothetical protein VB042_09645 [Victivallaceae bacterium]|nr:hypothetical protein [Victivallaceae bacterium]
MSGKTNKLLDIICSSTVIYVLTALLVICGGLLLWLMHYDAQRYRQEGERVSMGIEDFCDNSSRGEDDAIKINLYDADTILLVAKDAMTGNEFRYLTPECEADIDSILKDSNAPLVIFWLKGTYEVMASHPCRELSETHDILLKQNYFSANSVVRLRLSNQEVKEDNVKRTVFNIQ